MGRKNLDGCFGESMVVTVRLTPADREALLDLADRWSCSPSEALRRAVRTAARVTDEPAPSSPLEAIGFEPGPEPVQEEPVALVIEPVADAPTDTEILATIRRLDRARRNLVPVADLLVALPGLPLARLDALAGRLRVSGGSVCLL